MSKTQKYLKLQEEIGVYRKVLNEAADKVLDQEVTRYPIFVFHQHELEIGVPFIDAVKIRGTWSVNLSSLEDFTHKGLVEIEKVDAFKKVYKDPEIYFCVFVLSELGAEFVFLPREDV